MAKRLEEFDLGWMMKGGSKLQQAGRMIGQHAVETPKDAKRLVRAHRALSRRKFHATRFRLGSARDALRVGAVASDLTKAQRSGMARAVSSAERAVQRHNVIGTRWASQRDTAAKNLAKRGLVVAGVIGAGAAGRQAYRWMKRRAGEKARFSSYDVYPQYDHAAARGERYNRSVYYDPDEVGAGPPRIHEEDRDMLNEGRAKDKARQMLGLPKSTALRARANMGPHARKTIAKAGELVQGGRQKVSGTVSKARSNMAKTYHGAGGAKGILSGRAAARNMSRTYLKADKFLKDRGKRKAAEFSQAEKISSKGKYKDIYNKGYDRNVRRHAKGGIALHTGLAAMHGSPLLYAAGVGSEIAGAKYHSPKSIRAMGAHRAGVKSVLKAQRKEQKRNTTREYYKKEYAPEMRKIREKGLPAKARRGAGRLARRFAEDEREDLIFSIMDELFENLDEIHNPNQYSELPNGLRYRGQMAAWEKRGEKRKAKYEKSPPKTRGQKAKKRVGDVVHGLTRPIPVAGPSRFRRS